MQLAGKKKSYPKSWLALVVSSYSSFSVSFDLEKHAHVFFEIVFTLASKKHDFCCSDSICLDVLLQVDEAVPWKNAAGKEDEESALKLSFLSDSRIVLREQSTGSVQRGG